MLTGGVAAGLATADNPAMPIGELGQKIEILSLKPEVSAHYGDIRRSLEARGTPIGQNDLCIAAQARSLDAALVTDKEEEFRRVEGLRVETWQAR